jgi:tRNA G18 (ribose-2'-O)-methylase SpoU
MPVIEIEDEGDPRLDEFRLLPDPVLLRERGLFVAEGRLLARRLLASPEWAVRAVLVSDAGRAALSDLLDAAPGTLPVFVAARPVLAAVGGFNFHRGALALGCRRPSRALAGFLPPAGSPALLVALEGLTDADNVGSVFRNASAFGADGVVLSPGCVDPLYRKALRTSMGAALTVPHTVVDDWPAALKTLRDGGLTVVALSPQTDAVPLHRFEVPQRVALVVGAEGPGLGPITRQYADETVTIPMSPGVDSLNVATAAGIALYHLTVTKR